MTPCCPYCENDLSYRDEYFSGRPENFYGTAANGIHYPSTKKHLGNIYKCVNEDCEQFDQYFYTNVSGDLKEGYPC